MLTSVVVFYENKAQVFTAVAVIGRSEQIVYIELI